MALIKCKECGADISDRAEKCPKCGTANNSSVKENHNQKNYVIVGCIIVLLLVATVSAIYLQSNNNSVTATEKDTVSANLTSMEDDKEILLTDEFSENVSKYLRLENFSEGRAAVMDDNYKWGYIDTKGNIVVPTVYSAYPSARKYSDGLVFVQTDDKSCYIDRDGKEVITLGKYDIGSDFVNGKAVVYSTTDGYTVHGSFRVIDKNGKSLSEIPIPQNAMLISDGAEVYPIPVNMSEDGFSFLVDYENHKYDFQGNYLGVDKEDEYLISDPSEYDYIVFEEERGYGDYTTVTLHGIKDMQGNIIAPAKEWDFPNSKFHQESQQRYINPAQGVFLAVLYESPIYLKDIDDKRITNEEEQDASFYGFVNLKGEDTFQQKLWDRQTIQTHNKLNNITSY